MSGLLALREAASQFVADKYGIYYRPEDECGDDQLRLKPICNLDSNLGTWRCSASSGTSLSGLWPIVIWLGRRCEIPLTADRFVLTPEKLEKAILEQGEKLKAVINYR